MSKANTLTYVLVANVSDNSKPYYYAGYYNYNMPVNTNEFIDALKICFKDEAEKLCAIIKSNQYSFSYHIEEHCYA